MFSMGFQLVKHGYMPEAVNADSVQLVNSHRDGYGHCQHSLVNPASVLIYAAISSRLTMESN